MNWFEWLYVITFILLATEITKLVRILSVRPKLTKEPIDHFPFISIIVPARNEADRLPSLLDGLEKQDYPKDKFEVIVVNDHSEDNTDEVIDYYKTKISSLTKVEAGELPEGWAGKSFACHEGYKKAVGEYLCFVDADITPTPFLLRDTMAYELKHDLAALSLAPHQELVSWAEKVLLLPVFIMIATSLRSDEKILNGQFILFKRKVYEAIGGHDIDNVRNAISEDLGFAECLQKKNYPIDFVFAEHLLSCRMYSGYASVSNGVSKLIVRLMQNSIWMAARVSFIYFLVAFTGFISMLVLIGRSINHEAFFMQGLIVAIPLLLLAISIALTFYFRIFILFGLIIPFGFLYQPVFFFQSIRGKLRKYYEWRGRKVFN